MTLVWIYPNDQYNSTSTKHTYLVPNTKWAHEPIPNLFLASIPNQGPLWYEAHHQSPMPTPLKLSTPTLQLYWYQFHHRYQYQHRPIQINTIQSQNYICQVPSSIHSSSKWSTCLLFDIKYHSLKHNILYELYSSHDMYRAQLYSTSRRSSNGQSKSPSPMSKPSVPTLTLIHLLNHK